MQEKVFRPPQFNLNYTSHFSGMLSAPRVMCTMPRTNFIFQQPLAHVGIVSREKAWRYIGAEWCKQLCLWDMSYALYEP
jgi:hypothetical protein